MKLAYISGAYRSKSINGIHDNIQKARQVSIEYWRKGYAVICPHTNTAFMDGACEDHVWIEGDLEMLRRCDVVIMLPDWEESEGARAEYEEAVKHEKIIFIHR